MIKTKKATRYKVRVVYTYEGAEELDENVELTFKTKQEYDAFCDGVEYGSRGDCVVEDIK